MTSYRLLVLYSYYEDYTDGGDGGFIDGEEDVLGWIGWSMVILTMRIEVLLTLGCG